MESLKTLKDLKGLTVTKKEYEYMKPLSFPINYPNLISKQELKQEAIAWIKQLESDHPYETDDPIFTMDSYIKGQTDWIKMFFNLTEEDLK